MTLRAACGMRARGFGGATSNVCVDTPTRLLPPELGRSYGGPSLESSPRPDSALYARALVSRMNHLRADLLGAWSCSIRRFRPPGDCVSSLGAGKCAVAMTSWYHGSEILG